MEEEGLPVDIPLLERTPEQQERQPDLGPEGNETTYLRPAALAAYKTTLAETNRLCHDILQSDWVERAVSFNDQSVLYHAAANLSKSQVYILRGHVQNMPLDRLVTFFYKMPYGTGSDPLVTPIKELETFESDQIRVVQWETSSEVYPIFLSYLRGYKQVCGISVVTKGHDWVTHRFIPEHRHQVKSPNIRDGFVRLSVTPGDLVTTVTIIFGIPCEGPLDDFWMSKLQAYLPYLQQLNANWTHYV